MYDQIKEFIKDIKENWSEIKRRTQFSRSRYFYNRELISKLVFNRSFLNLPKNNFINYSLAFRYYSKERTKYTLVYKDAEKEVELPYSEIINFVKNPDAVITFEFTSELHKLSDVVINETSNALNQFLEEKPNTNNGKVLRIFEMVTNGKNLLLKLQNSNYFNLVRTNLTLDYPLNSDGLRTLRIDDLTENNSMNSFDKSLLTNSIGVSSVLMFKNKGEFHFYMKPRKGDLGVFGNMLGSVSGVVNGMPEAVKSNNLLDYIKTELLRELSEETGINRTIIERDLKFKIIPLAFTRELLRGGKPQFFYLIVMENIDEKEFHELFKVSEGKDEFKTDWLTNIKSYDDFISPELTTNFVYAFQYIQHKEKIKTDKIILKHKN